MFLLDTHVLSALRRPETAAPALVAWAGAVEAQDMYLSAISVFELELGVQRLQRRDAAQGEILRSWLDRGILARFRDRILAVDAVVAARCAGLHVPNPRFERDSFIAATALVHRLTVVTRNRHDFESMGVPVLNPWEG